MVQPAQVRPYFSVKLEFAHRIRTGQKSLVGAKKKAHIANPVVILRKKTSLLAYFLKVQNSKVRSLSVNIARIAKRCPGNITSIVKCVKLLFPKLLRTLTLFVFFTVVTAVPLKLHDLFFWRLHVFFAEWLLECFV